MHMSLPGIGPASCVEPTNRLRTLRAIGFAKFLIPAAEPAIIFL